jgi:hypothetical protein
MTENEAKMKWCPMVRDGGTYQGMIFNGINSAECVRGGYDCIASGCMMWRDDGVHTTSGHCGLAGKI